VRQKIRGEMRGELTFRKCCFQEPVSDAVVLNIASALAHAYGVRELPGSTQHPLPAVETLRDFADVPGVVDVAVLEFTRRTLSQ
jgi:hypothetical protein